MSESVESVITHRKVLALAWPLIIANTASPLLGLVDTAALGHQGSAVDLGAMALGSLVFNFLYWSFGFLRMTTTGFVAQAHGAGDLREASAAAVRPILLGLVVGTCFFAAQGVIERTAFVVLSAGEAEEKVAGAYFRARIWGAPAALSSLGCLGYLIGAGRSRSILLIQLLTNGLNIILDIVFVFALGWGAEGVGWGTALSEWCGAAYAIVLVIGAARPDWQGSFVSLVLDRKRLLAMFHANRDVMIRTMAMIAGFSVFTNQGAKMGVETLAANHILLQFVSLSAFFLDGFAHVAESLVGKALGARSVAKFDESIRRSSEVAVFFALSLGFVIYFGGRAGIVALSSIEAVQNIALIHLGQVASYVACSVLAFQLDGIFIGATSTKAMRNTSLLSLAWFLLLSHLLTAPWGNYGLWWAFVGYVCMRGVSLAFCVRPLREQVLNADHALPL